MDKGIGTVCAIQAQGRNVGARFGGMKQRKKERCSRQREGTLKWTGVDRRPALQCGWRTGCVEGLRLGEFRLGRGAS